MAQLQQDSDEECRHTGISICITRGKPEEGTAQSCGACVAHATSHAINREHECTSESLLRKLESGGVWMVLWLHAMYM